MSSHITRCTQRASPHWDASGRSFGVSAIPYQSPRAFSGLEEIAHRASLTDPSDRVSRSLARSQVALQTIALRRRHRGSSDLI